MAKSSFEALKNYESTLNALKELTASRRGQASNQTLRYKILSVLHARDQLEQVLHDRCQEPYPLPSSMLEQIDQLDKLDKRLKKQSGAIAKWLDLEKWRKLYKVTDTERWWWYSVHPCDRFDWLWKFLTVGCVVVFLSILLDFIPRFWAGGPSVWGAIAVVGPALLTWFFGKDLSEGVSWIRQNLDAALEKTKIPIPKFWRREVALLLALILTGLAWCNSQNFKSWIANQYYNSAVQHLKLQENSYSGSQRLSDSKFLADAEANLKRAIAFNPDHAEAHFELGWLFEQRQDVEEARKEYKLAMQSNSLIARIRLARLYLLDEKENSTNAAAVILLQNGRSIVEQFPYLEDQKSWYTAMGWARLQQKRYEEAEEELDNANQVHEKLKNTIPNYIDDPKNKPPTTFYCVRAAVLEKLNKQEAAREKWKECADSSNPRDLDEDWWLTKAKQRVKD